MTQVVIYGEYPKYFRDFSLLQNKDERCDRHWLHFTIENVFSYPVCTILMYYAVNVTFIYFHIYYFHLGFWNIYWRLYSCIWFRITDFPNCMWRNMFLKVIWIDTEGRGSMLTRSKKNLASIFFEIDFSRFPCMATPQHDVFSFVKVNFLSKRVYV